MRRTRAQDEAVVCIGNFAPVVRSHYRVGVPAIGDYAELLNSDAQEYGGSGVGNHGKLHAEAKPWDGQPASVELTLPPLGVLWLQRLPDATEKDEDVDPPAEKTVARRPRRDRRFVPSIIPAKQRFGVVPWPNGSMGVSCYFLNIPPPTFGNASLRRGSAKPTDPSGAAGAV